MGFLFGTTPARGQFSILGQGAAAFVGSGANALLSSSGLSSVDFLGSSGAGGNPWDMPTADVTLNISSPFTAAKFHTALSSVLADGQVYEIVAPVASTLAHTTTDILTEYNITNKKVSIKLNGCGLDMSAADDRRLVFSSDYVRIGDRITVDTVMISSVQYSRLTFLDLTSGQVASLYPIGTVVKVYSNARYFGDITVNRRQGEHMVVLAQSGATVTLYCPLVTGGTQTLLNYQFPTSDQGGGTPYGATNDIRCAKFNTTTRLWIDKPRWVRTQSNTGDLFTMKSLYAWVLRNGETSEFADAAVKGFDNFGGYEVDPNIHDGSPGSPNGYANQLLGKNNQILRTSAIATASIAKCRHSFDATGVSPSVTTAAATQDNVRNFGGAFNNMITGVLLTGMKSSALALHSQSDKCKIVGCPGRSPDTLSQYYWTIRGKQHHIDGTPPFGNDGVDYVGGRTVVRYGRGFQFYTYCADPVAGGGSASAADGYWRDGSDALIEHMDMHCLSGGGSMIDCSPGASGSAPNGFRHMRVLNSQFNDVIWRPEGSSQRCNHSGRGDWFSTDCQLIYGALCQNFYNLTKPNPTTDPYGSGDPYPGAQSTWDYTDEVIDLAGLSGVGIVTLTIWNVGANCRVTGNADIINKPANITLVGGTGMAGAGTKSISVTVH